MDATRLIYKFEHLSETLVYSMMAQLHSQATLKNYSESNLFINRVLKSSYCSILVQIELFKHE